MGALHQQQQQQQQRSRMLGLMQSPAAQAAVNQTQFPPPAAPRMLFHGTGNTSAAARNLFPNPTESSAPSSDSVYYPRPPVLLAEHFFADFLLASAWRTCCLAVLCCFFGLTPLVGRQEGHPACKKVGRCWRLVLLRPDGVAPSRMVGVSASVSLPLHHKVQKFSSGTGSPEWSWKKGRKTIVVWCGKEDCRCSSG